jgi:membrane carboxypeptidase/penicillin-binding protein PbpC
VAVAATPKAANPLAWRNSPRILIFMGVVTAASALRRSLNQPAVKLMRRYRPDRFAAHLKAAGAPLALPLGAKPTLPLALEAGGISMRRLAALYAGLAINGNVTRLHWLKGVHRRARRWRAGRDRGVRAQRRQDRDHLFVWLRRERR